MAFPASNLCALDPKVVRFTEPGGSGVFTEIKKLPKGDPP
jgi:hypothetical protein